MSTLNINLSPALQAELSQQGIYAYALYFNNAGNPVVTTIANGATTTPWVASSVALDMPLNLASGKVFFIVQSVAPGQPSTLFGSNGITTESQIGFTGSN